jgi:hypothetical protein
MAEVEAWSAPDTIGGQRLRATVAALASVTAERDEARAALAEMTRLAESTKSGELGARLAIAEAEKQAAEVREVALRAALEGIAATFTGNPDSTEEMTIHDFDSVSDFERACEELAAIRAVHAALAAPDPGAWVRREELESVLKNADGSARELFMSWHRAELRRVAEAVRLECARQCSTQCNEGCETRIDALDLATLLEGTR